MPVNHYLHRQDHYWTTSTTTASNEAAFPSYLQASAPSENSAALPCWGRMRGCNLDLPLLQHRLLQSSLSNTADGTLTVLMIICALFCLIWVPATLRRCQADTRRLHDPEEMARYEAEARIVRAALERMARDQNSNRHHLGRTGPHGMTLEDRREFLDNALCTKKIMLQTGQNDDAGNANVLPAKTSNSMTKESSTSETKAIPELDESDVSISFSNSHDLSQNTTIEEPLPCLEEPCAICLTEYEGDDDICWSHNKHCNHFFHRQCIREWLLAHEDCPCCRQEFFNFEDTDDDDDDAGEASGERSSNPHANSIRDARREFDWTLRLAQELAMRLREQEAISTHRRQDPGLSVRSTVLSVEDMSAAGLLFLGPVSWYSPSTSIRRANSQVELAPVSHGHEMISRVSIVPEELAGDRVDHEEFYSASGSTEEAQEDASVTDSRDSQMDHANLDCDGDDHAIESILDLFRSNGEPEDTADEEDTTT